MLFLCVHVSEDICGYAYGYLFIISVLPFACYRSLLALLTKSSRKNATLTTQDETQMFHLPWLEAPCMIINKRNYFCSTRHWMFMLNDVIQLTVEIVDK